MGKRTKLILLLAFLIITSSLFTILYFPNSKKIQSQPYRTFSSPDNRFKIEVYSYDVKEVSFPGHSGDMPGIVYLKDSKSNKILRQRELEMVQLIENPEWTKKTVKAKLQFDWILPPSINPTEP